MKTPAVRPGVFLYPKAKVSDLAMIYAEKEKNETQFVSVNTLTRGRILRPEELGSGINPSPASTFQAMGQSNQSRAPSAGGTEVELQKGERETTGEDVQAKTMTAAASAVNPPDGTVSKPVPTGSNTFPGGVEPLPAPLRARMEAAIGGDFAAVRLHHDASAAAMAKSLDAKAFTHQTNIYFNHGQYQPGTTAGLHLLAHELAHVKQQTTISNLAAKLKEPVERAQYEQEADNVANKVTGFSRQPAGRKTGTGLHSSVSWGGGRIQLKRDQETQAATVSDANWFMTQVSKLVRNIPGYDLLAMAIGHDPLTGKAVQRDDNAWFKAVAGLLPGGARLFEHLQQAGVIAKAITWIKEEIKKLEITSAKIKDLLDKAWTAIAEPQIQTQGRENEKKDWLAKLANTVNDVAGKAVKIGQALFTPEETFAKINEIFGPLFDRINGFLSTVGPKLKEFTLEGALTLAQVPMEKIKKILNKGKEIFQAILDDPAGFLSNLLQAIREGLKNFRDKFGTYLRNGLVGWLFEVLDGTGIIFPDKLDLGGIFSLIAQILGVTWQAIKNRVIGRLGPAAEKVMVQVEKTVTVIAEFITKGPIALYEIAAEYLGNLKERFFDKVIDWARNTLIVKGVQKLISMFNPVTAVIQALMTIGKTIKYFIDQARQIASLTNAVFDSIAEVVIGNLKKAIDSVEDSLAKALPVAIGFIANLAGIGGIATKIKDVIKELRKPIDQAVEKVINFVADKAQALLGKNEKSVTTEEKDTPEKAEKVSRGLAAIDQEEQKYLKGNKISRDNTEKVATTVKKAHPVFKALTVVDGGDTWDYEYVASPKKIKKGPEKAEEKSDDKIDQGFNTFRELKKAIGPAGERKVWHHIVEQSQIEKSGFSPKLIHNTKNIIAIDSTIHTRISGYYSTKPEFTRGKTIRDWLAGQSYQKQYQFGLNVLKRFGINE